MPTLGREDERAGGRDHASRVLRMTSWGLGCWLAGFFARVQVFVYYILVEFYLCYTLRFLLF